MELLRSVTGHILIEGHRGAEGVAVENTRQAIEAGYAAGADLLELDVQRTVDGELVIYHSYQLPDGRWIRDLRTTDLRAVIYKGHGLLFLEEVLEWVRDKSIGLSLDIKNGFGFDPRVFLDTLSRVEAHKLVDKVMLIGWDHAGLLLCKKHNPDIKTCALIRGRPVDIVQMAQNARVDAVNLDADMTTSVEVDALHQAGIAVVTAEVISPDFSRPVKVGADVVCCKDPGAARAAISVLSLD
ncbi:MAG: glycerophosphodiester phosphodiesterase [Anaerolineae bacterium]|nr:glycerophosphodiester phosphodiesterase [Anaerolineae bacterium]